MSIKSENVAPLRKITKPFLKRWICFISSNFWHINRKNVFHKVCSPYPHCIIKFSFRPILSKKNLPKNWQNVSKNGQIFFAQNQPKYFFKLWNVGMGNKLYEVKFLMSKRIWFIFIELINDYFRPNFGLFSHWSHALKKCHLTHLRLTKKSPSSKLVAQNYVRQG